jgi:hypothetical protein
VIPGQEDDIGVSRNGALGSVPQTGGHFVQAIAVLSGASSPYVMVSIARGAADPLKGAVPPDDSPRGVGQKELRYAARGGGRPCLEVA